MLPLKLEMVGCATQEEMNGNILATIERGYTPINGLLGKYAGTVSLVGSGPSIRNTLHELTGAVIAINSAIGFLLDNGIVPQFAMLWDAADIVEQFAVPHPDITYLVAARCHPKVFERLKDCKVIVWYAGGDHNIYEFMSDRKMQEPMVNGGSAGITRGLYLAYALGFRDFHVFGADSSYSDEGQTHVRGSLVPEKDIMVSIGSQVPHWFRTTPEWCAQVEEYRAIYALFTHRNTGATMHAHGSGMLPTMHAMLVEQKTRMGEDGFIENCAAQERHRLELAGQLSKAQQEDNALLEMGKEDQANGTTPSNRPE